MSTFEYHLGAVRATTGHRNTRSILLLGEDNPQSSDPDCALWPEPSGCAGERLKNRIMGLDRASYLSLWRTNLCNPTWDSREARTRAWSLIGRDVPWTNIICLGAKVAKIMGWASPLILWETSRIELNERVFTLLYLPHPSGRCFVWNDPESYSLAMNALVNLDASIPWGVVH